jgi:two-component system, chemotaxis family, sensor kinase CheA
MTDELFAGFLDDYFAESEEHVSGARSALLSLESASDQPAQQRRIIDELFRFFHSLKGISAMVELRPAEQLAHGLEDYLRAVRADELTVTPEGLTLLIDGTDLIEKIVNAYRNKQGLPAIGEVLARIGRSLPRTGNGTADAGPRPGELDASPVSALWKCSFSPTRELLDRGIGVDSIRRRLSEVATIVEASPSVMPDASINFNFIVEAASGVDLGAMLRDDPMTVEAIVRPEREQEPPATMRPDIEGHGSVSPSHVVRVDLTRLDDLMRQVGDLVISRARLLDSLSRIEPYVPAVEWRDAQENAVAIDRQVRTLREGLMRLRLVPVGEIFRRMPFVVRDLAREMGRKVTILLHGQSTEIDKYLIERMMDPVLHLVRNAVSHGIEPPDERIGQGKQPEGTITLTASAAGELVTIEITDDGRGVDADDVAARARRAGLPVPAGTLDSATVLALLCSPGFSTKDDTDRASGRGVGMAVVKDTVERLSGTMTMESTPGHGTRFTIQLPLTLAIADALIGRVGTESFAVPQSAVREAIEVMSADVRTIEGNEIVPYRQKSLAIVHLSRLFGIDARPLSRFHVFVIGTGAAAIGIAVDRIVGQREIVVRSIADPLVRVEGISGATDLGDGKVVLIIDPAALARVVRQRTARRVGSTADWGRVRA